jgi:hypothetical protein
MSAASRPSFRVTPRNSRLSRSQFLFLPKNSFPAQLLFVTTTCFPLAKVFPLESLAHFYYYYNYDVSICFRFVGWTPYNYEWCALFSHSPVRVQRMRPCVRFLYIHTIGQDSATSEHELRSGSSPTRWKPLGGGGGGRVVSMTGDVCLPYFGRARAYALFMTHRRRERL